MDAAMQVVRESVDTGRPVWRHGDLVDHEQGPVNYHCAECGTLLIRNASTALPDVIVICSVCLTLNEAAQSDI
jgi:hypothetical protein